MILLAFLDRSANPLAARLSVLAHLFGVLAFWSGLSLMHSDSEWNKFVYFLHQPAADRSAPRCRDGCSWYSAVSAAAAYVGHLAYSVFKDSMLFVHPPPLAWR